MEKTDRKIESPFNDGELEYCDLIANIGYKFKTSLIWWASSVSSKNFGISPLWKKIRLFLEEGKETYQRKNAFKLILCFCYAIWRFFLPASLIMRCKFRYSKINYYTDNIIFTHLNKSYWNSGTYTDHYWKPFCDYLAKKNIRFLLIGIVITDNHFVRAKLISQECEKGLVLPVYRFMSLTDILKAFFISVFAKIRLPKIISFENKNIRPLLKEEFRVEKYNGIIFTNICYYYAFRKIMRKLNPKRVYWPWENHSWEKMAVLAQRSESPSTATIGHLHSSIPMYLLNHFPGKKEESYAPFPDKIFTCGNIPFQKLREFGHFPENCLNVGCAFRYDYLYGIPLRKNPIPAKIKLGLCFPSYLQPSLIMLQNTIDAFENTNVQVVIKFHPSVPDKLILNNFKMPDNFDYSHSFSNIGEYLSAIDVLLYSETAVCLEAAMSGIPCVYLNTGKGCLGDSMFNNQALKWSVSNAAELIECINKIQSLPLEELNYQRKEARTYVEEYFRPVTKGDLIKLTEA